MSIEEKLGRVLERQEVQGEDIRYIKDNMVQRSEFDIRVAEHTVFRSEIDNLKENYLRGHWPRKMGQHIVIVVLTTIVGIVVAAIWRM